MGIQLSTFFVTLYVQKSIHRNNQQKYYLNIVSNNQEEEKPSSTSSLEATIITKPAKTDHPINELIAKRWSARAFSTRPVERLKLLSVLEAARWAPSSRNEQPWRYIIFTNDNPEKLKAQSVLKDMNNYAKRAPVLICAITKKTVN
jgi:hypothetical protein